MNSLPALRCRTEYSFRSTFAPLARVAAACARLEASAAAICDAGTWGHVEWAAECGKAGVKPLFGCELPVLQPDGLKPLAWALAEDTRAFYRFSSAARVPGADIEALFRRSPGLIRFSGAALTDPDTFDYIDMNPASPLQQQKALALHKRTKRPLVVTSDNAYALPEDYAAFMAIAHNERATPQHLLSEAELRAALPCLTAAQWRKACANTHEVAARAASKLPAARLIHFPGDLRALTEAGKQERCALGHIAAWTDAYEQRLQRELDVIIQKQFESYFLVVSDLIVWAKRHMLVGPGRGSSAGSLVCYCLRITEVDPLVHELLFERFLDLTRSDLPDVDVDFSDVRREQVFTYLADKYGRDNVARIGSINTLRARSVLARVTERLAIPEREKFDVLNVLIDYSSGDSRYGHALEDTMAQTEPGKRFLAAHPEAAVMFALENHASHTGVHAAGVIVCNEPINEFCTVGADGVAQLDKSCIDPLGLLKIDALGLRTLGVIEDAGVVTADELYALKLDDPAVFALLNAKRYAGVFQFEGQAMRRVASEVQIKSFREIDHITALARPGPLGGGASQRYIARAAGREQVVYRHPSMAAYLGDTMGVVLYQEQVMRIVREIGQFSWEDTTMIRKGMSGRRGQEFFDQKSTQFVAGATNIGLSREDAEAIWGEICTFGAWGMNRAHTCAYAVISYWCAHMKVYHPLEYAAACLRNVKDDEQATELLRDMRAEGVAYVAFDAARSGVDWSVVDGELLGGFKNLVGYGPAKSTKALEQRAAGKLDLDKLAKHEVKYAELYPLSRAYAALYADPTAFGCREGSVVSRLDALPHEGDALVVCKVLRKELRDENETVRLGKRDGRRLTGATLFLDIFVTDDTGTPITARIDRFKFPSIGKSAAELLQPGDALLLRGKKIPNFAMIKVLRMKVLNREVAL